MKPITLKLMKEDETIKEPYTDAELRRLLKRPEGNSWVEWRTWASINYLIATGNRASTLLNVKISDVDFENMTVRLVKTKSRKQQIIPLSPALKQILLDYLKTWDWTTDDYLFPSNEGAQLNLRSFQGAVRRYNIERGVSKTSIHLFRHTFAKNFILAGGGMVQLQALLGHASCATVPPTYYEKTDNLLETFNAGGNTYRILQNVDNYVVVWLTPHFECCISMSADSTDISSLKNIILSMQ